MIRVLIADDEPLARRRIRRLLAAHPDVEVAGEAAEGEGAIAQTLRLAPDVILLDIAMPERSGTEVAAEIARRLPEALRPLVVFTTAHEEHAVRAFALEALDYLTKPVEAAALERALRRARERIAGRGPGTGSGAPGDAGSAGRSPPGAPMTHCVATEGSKLLRIPLAEVGAIEVEREQVLARTAEGPRRLAESLAELEARLPSPPFLRVSRQAIVNLDWIAHVEPGFGGALVAKLRAPLSLEVAVSRRRAAALRARL